MKKGTKIAIASLTAATTALVVASSKVAKKITTHNTQGELDLVGLKIVRIRNFKGQLLTGYLANNQSDTTMILIHPSNTSGLDMVSYYEYFKDQLDINYLLIDLAGYGKSEGENITFDGSYESDLIEWIQYLKRNHTTKVVLYGKQLGANIILNDLPELKKMNIVKCIAVDGATVSNEKMIEEQVNSFFPLIKQIIGFITKLILKYRYHIPFAQQEILENLHNYSEPILFIQSRKDPLVSFKKVFDVYNAKADNKELILIKDQAYLYENTQDDPYYSVLLEFIQNTL